jgi:hypothetical protein
MSKDASEVPGKPDLTEIILEGLKGLTVEERLEHLERSSAKSAFEVNPSLEGRIAALERFHADEVSWRKDSQPYPHFDYVTGTSTETAIKYAVFLACRGVWLLVRCAAIYAVGRAILR